MFSPYGYIPSVYSYIIPDQLYTVKVYNCTEITVQTPVLISLLLEYDLSDTMSGDKWYLYMFINACHATASTPIITKSASFSYRENITLLSLPVSTS